MFAKESSKQCVTRNLSKCGSVLSGADIPVAESSRDPLLIAVASLRSRHRKMHYNDYRCTSL